MNSSFELVKEKIESKGVDGRFLVRCSDEVEKIDLEILKSNYLRVKERKAIFETLSDAAKRDVLQAERIINNQVQTVIDEIANNVWYFLRDIVQVPHGIPGIYKPLVGVDPRMADDESLYLHPWECAYAYCYDMNTPIIVEGYVGMMPQIIISCINLHATFKQIWEYKNAERAFSFKDIINSKVIISDMPRQQILDDVAGSMILNATLDKWPFLNAYFASYFLIQPDISITETSEIGNIHHVLDFSKDEWCKWLSFLVDGGKTHLPVHNIVGTMPAEFPAHVKEYALSMDYGKHSYDYRFCGVISETGCFVKQDIAHMINSGDVAPFSESIYGSPLYDSRGMFAMNFVLYLQARLEDNLPEEYMEEYENIKRMITFHGYNGKGRYRLD